MRPVCCAEPTTWSGNPLTALLRYRSQDPIPSIVKPSPARHRGCTGEPEFCLRRSSVLRAPEVLEAVLDLRCCVENPRIMLILPDNTNVPLARGIALRRRWPGNADTDSADVATCGKTGGTVARRIDRCQLGRWGIGRTAAPGDEVQRRTEKLPSRR